jgi:hypothetical protein
MRTHVPTFLLLITALLLTACPAKESPAPAPAKEAPKEAAKPDEPPPPPTEIKPLTSGALAVEPLQKVVSKLNAAHYDAETLGLRTLSAVVVFTSKKNAMEAEGEVVWKSGSPPEVKLTRVSKNGKEIPKPDETNPEDVGKAVGWSDLQFKVLKLVEGLGNGYLAHRLLEWKEAKKGEVTREEEMLVLTLDQGEQGTVRIEVGEGYVVRRVVAVHPKGFTRSMDYSVRLHEGRNLVTSAMLEASGKPGAKLHKRAVMMLKAIHGTKFEIGYAPVGRFLMPVKLQKVIPSQSEEINMVITYNKAE